MQKTAFMFPGQGSQYAGMGRSLAATYSEARAVFEEVDDALGFAISQLCFEGPEKELRMTENAQPALLAAGVASYRILEKIGLRPSFVAGHSLGEYSALVAAGSLQLSDAARLVRERACYMQAAVPAGQGAMTALLKMPEGRLDAVLAEAAQGEVVSVANRNSPDQVVIAGHAAAVHRASDLAKAAGARRVVPLAVSAPFHCSLMKPAQQQMLASLKSAKFADLRFPLINNREAREIRTGEDARWGLVEQISNPVLWSQSMQHLVDRGVTQFIEVGPGTVLCGLIRNISKSLEAIPFGEVEDAQKLESALVVS